MFMFTSSCKWQFALWDFYQSSETAYQHQTRLYSTTTSLIVTFSKFPVNKKLKNFLIQSTVIPSIKTIFRLHVNCIYWRTILDQYVKNYKA